jgi:predicted RND superfamily exporter protein
LLALLLATAWAAAFAARLELDVENRSMRSSNGADAAFEERRGRLFGNDAQVVFLLQPSVPAGGEDEEGLDAWVAGMQGRAEASGSFLFPGRAPGERLLALTLVPDEAGTVSHGLASLSAAAAASAPATHRLFVSGSPAGEAAIATALEREQRRILPLVGGVLVALLLAVYRSLVLAAGALLPALAGIAWTGALQYALDVPVNPVTALLPPVLLAVGVAGAVHLVDAYLDERAGGAEPEGASRRACAAVLAPAAGCAATTVVGFLALCTSPMPAIRSFGLLAALGVALTAALSFLVLPAWLRRFARADGLRRRSTGRGRWRALSIAAGRALAHRARSICAAAALAALVLAWSWTRLGMDTDPLRILPAHHPFRLATDEIGARLGGTEVCGLLLDPPGPSGVFALLGLQRSLEEVAGVAGPGGPPRTAADGTGLVPLLLAPAGSSAREATLAMLEARAREHGWSAARATGWPVRVARDSGAIARGELRGLAATFVVLGPCIWLGLRSLRLTGLGLAANALPCLLLHGGLALAGRPLSVASAMIGSVLLGLVVDSAIYLLHGYRSARARLGPRLAVASTLKRSGRAVSVTSLVLALGFLAGVSGELATTREFGFLAATSILCAWASNVLLLPALLLVSRRAPSRAL